MTEIIEETTTTGANNGQPVVKSPVVTKATHTQTSAYLVYYIFGFLEILLAFRLVLKIAGANSFSIFVSWIYGITGLFILPFQGIFRQGFAPGAVSTSVFEPSVIVALIVYGLLAWGIVKLLQITSGQQQDS